MIMDMIKPKLILSHNDSDHFDGIPKLLEQKKLSGIYTTLLLKYKKDILKIIDDGRRTENGIIEEILDKYDNICTVVRRTHYDVYEKNRISDGVEIVGPDKDYMLGTVAKRPGMVEKVIRWTEKRQ